MEVGFNQVCPTAFTLNLISCTYRNASHLFMHLLCKVIHATNKYLITLVIIKVQIKCVFSLHLKCQFHDFAYLHFHENTDLSLNNARNKLEVPISVALKHGKECNQLHLSLVKAFSSRCAGPSSKQQKVPIMS